MGSGWTISSVDGHFVNVVKYRPLEGNSYIPLPVELRHCKKGLDNLKNEENECFRWCHVRLLNPQERNPQQIKTTDTKMVEELSY